MSQYRGKVVILTFLSAGCGKVCIVLAQQIRGALDELGRDVPVLAVSTDPSADTQAQTTHFLREVSLTGRMQYLTGPERLLSSIWRSYGIASTNASKVSLSEGTALVLLIDKLGRERISFLLEQLTPEGLSTQVRKLLAEASSP
jgi:protein SCO1/2